MSVSRLARWTVKRYRSRLKIVNPSTQIPVKWCNTPIPASEINAIRQVLIGTVGFDESRGDLLNVLSMQFAPQITDVVPDVPIWEHPNFNDWVRWFASALVIIVVVLVLVRPAMKKLLNPAADNDEQMYGPDGMPIAPMARPASLVVILKVASCLNLVQASTSQTFIKMKTCWKQYVHL